MTIEPRWVLLIALGTGLAVAAALLLAKRVGLLDARPDRVIVYKQLETHSLKLHLFEPRRRDRTRPAPVLMLFHGGAWQLGSPAQFYPQCRHFSALGLACVSVGYRIRSVHGTPPAAAVQDARDAIRYLRRHASGLGLDPARIAAGGGSAGGHLAAALGTGIELPDPGQDERVSVRPDALVLYNPMLDLAPGQPDHELVGDDWQQLSPLAHVDGATPPTLILSGTQDPEVPVATVEAFCSRVRDRGGRCATALYEGAGHGFFNPSVERGRWYSVTNAAVAEFLAALGFIPGS